MLVTDVCEYKGDTWKIELDGERNFFVNALIIKEFDLEKGLTIPTAALNQIIRADMLRKAKKRGMYLIGERDYGYNELYSKLKKTYNEEIARKAVNYISSLGYINDEEYAPKLADHLIKCKHYGLRKAKYEMLNRGLDSELVEKTLGVYSNEQLDKELTALIERKYSGKISDPNDLRRTTAALIRRGYDYGSIKRCIQKLVQV